jgi:hypothetical protein
VTDNTDCDDANINVHPSSPEVCNGIDDDCNGQIDEGVQTVFYADSDNDGFGNIAADSLACAQPAGYVQDSTDCDDSNINVNPSATETCNGLDDDCDAAVDEDDPGGGASCPVEGEVGACADGATECFEGHLVCRQIHEPSPESCNGADDDCDGMTDEIHVFGGYLPPVDPEGGSIFRHGRAVPFKFRLADCAGAPVPGAVATIEVFFYMSGIVGSQVEEVESRAASNTDNLYRYDPEADQYVYNLDTRPLLPGSSYLVRTTLDDGSAHDVVVSIK